jgi:hypothetical protein
VTLVDGPGTHLGDHGGFGRVPTDTCRVAGTVRIDARALRGAGPGEHVPRVARA